MSTKTTAGDRTRVHDRAGNGHGHSETPDYSTVAIYVRETPTYPVPEAAKGPVVGPDGYLIQELADGVFWLSDGSYQSMFVVTDDGVIAVDAPPTLGNDIPRAIAKVTRKPVTGVVYSHQHSDHVGAMSVFPDNVPYYAQRATADRLLALGDPLRPAPTHVFDDTLTIDAGDHTLRLDYPGPNHAEGNIFIHVPKQRVLMLVDVIFPGWVPFSNLALSANVPGFIKAHEQALAYDFDTLVGGHVTRPGTPADVRTQFEYMTDLRETAEAALSSVDLPATFARVDTGNVWAVFRAYLDARCCADRRRDRAAVEGSAGWRRRLHASQRMGDGRVPSTGLEFNGPVRHQGMKTGSPLTAADQRQLAGLPELAVDELSDARVLARSAPELASDAGGYSRARPDRRLGPALPPAV